MCATLTDSQLCTEGKSIYQSIQYGSLHHSFMLLVGHIVVQWPEHLARRYVHVQTLLGGKKISLWKSMPGFIHIQMGCIKSRSLSLKSPKVMENECFFLLLWASSAFISRPLANESYLYASFVACAALVANKPVTNVELHACDYAVRAFYNLNI